MNDHNALLRSLKREDDFGWFASPATASLISMTTYIPKPALAHRTAYVTLREAVAQERSYCSLFLENFSMICNDLETNSGKLNTKP
jgi:hypothetical protein